MHKMSLECLLTLLKLRGVGRKKVRRFLASLTSEVMTTGELRESMKASQVLRSSVRTVGELETAFSQAQRVLDRSTKLGVVIIPCYDEAFPRRLLTTSDPPVLLHVRGNPTCLNVMPAVAVIGTRQPTKFGQETAAELGELFSENGFNVVSGLAIGCDAAAHRGALRGGGFTTAVLAHGLDTVYPSVNVRLAEDILSGGGCLVSEYSVDTKPLRRFFVDRDRIQAGLSDAVVVVETDVTGGTMHTVDFARTAGRKVACLTGHPGELTEHPKTRGNRKLLTEGAIDLGDREDVLQLISALREGLSD